MNINDIILNEENPRYIKTEQYEKLKKSLQEFPEMLSLRPIIIDENNVVLGGNMRLRACEELGITEIPVKVAKGLTEEQKKEFVVKDNLGYGEWDWDMLANQYDIEELEEWGLQQVKNVTQDKLFGINEEDEENYKTDVKYPVLILATEEEYDKFQEIKSNLNCGDVEAFSHILKEYLK